MAEPAAQQSICRDCLASVRAAVLRCPHCHSPRLVHHEELHQLSIAHIDCDAFYAAIEKRDNPALRDKAVIVGGGERGVVSTACYIARIKGVKSAMPMFKARALCPEAEVVKPNMAKYAEAAKQVRALMLEFTPLVQPVSIDNPRGLFMSEAIFARNLLCDKPTETLTPTSFSILCASFMRDTAGDDLCSLIVPERSKKASSIETG